MKKNNVTELPMREREASLPLIEKWAALACDYGDDAPARVRSFLLILDEIERAAGNRSRIDGIVWAAQRAAFGISDQADDARKQFVETLREKHGLRVVAKKRKTG